VMYVGRKSAMTCSSYGWSPARLDQTDEGLHQRKPRHDLRYTGVHVSRPDPVYINSNNTNCCGELN
jgi:hypothetical protein